MRFLVKSAFLMLGSAIGAYADPCCPPKPCCEPVVCPCLPDDCCQRNVCPPTCVINPKVDLIKCPEMDFFVTGDYIYWTAREDNLEFAAVAGQNIAALANGPVPLTSNEVFRLDKSKYQSGFKVGAGLDFCHDGWDLYAEYTGYSSDMKKSTPVMPLNIPTPGFLLTNGPNLLDLYWGVNGGFPFGLMVAGNNSFDTNGLPFINSASAKWRLNFNTVDLELGRNFYVSPRLMLRPFCGLKGAWNRQHMNVKTTTQFLVTYNSSMHNKIKTWGAGLRAGLDSAWHFTRSFSLIGDLALTGLWEKFKLRRFDGTLLSGPTVVGPTPPINLINWKETQHGVKPVIEWMLGLKWETGFSCDEYHLSVTAAWEEQVWFGQNKFLRFCNNASGTGGDLSLQGLTVDARFDF